MCVCKEGRYVHGALSHHVPAPVACPACARSAGSAKRVTNGAKVQMQLVDEHENVVHVKDLETCYKDLTPVVLLSGKALHELGLGAILSTTDINGELFWSKGTETQQIAVQVVLTDAKIGDVLELPVSRSSNQVRKVSSIKAIRSTGVAGASGTLAARWQFVLTKHAPIANTV